LAFGVVGVVGVRRSAFGVWRSALSAFPALSALSAAFGVWRSALSAFSAFPAFPAFLPAR
jgi:hypothetical protein